MSLKQFHGHYAVIFGILCGLLDLDAVVLQRMYLFYTLRDILSDATRLNLIGPMESLKLQQELAATAEEILQKNKNRKIEQCHHSAPFLEIMQGNHDRLYSRIFNS